MKCKTESVFCLQGSDERCEDSRSKNDKCSTNGYKTSKCLVRYHSSRYFKYQCFFRGNCGKRYQKRYEICFYDSCAYWRKLLCSIVDDLTHCGAVVYIVLHQFPFTSKFL